MNFASDNSGPVHPKVMDALVNANTGYALPYGKDDLTTQTLQDIRNLFDAPNAAVFLTSLGTAANSITLATLTQPPELEWQPRSTMSKLLGSSTHWVGAVRVAVLFSEP